MYHQKTNQVVQLKQFIDAAEQVVFFGGAGVSTESGVPDFRGAHGIYKQHLNAEEILSRDFMYAYENEFWAFYRRYLLLKDVHPNPAHLCLAALEKAGKVTAVITQNVDGLHQAAGSRKVIELHGNGTRYYCRRCGKTYGPAEIEAMDTVPHCTCGGSIRPDIVLYQEALDNEAIEGAVAALAAADLVIVGGTSLRVYPAAGLIRYQKKGRLVIINRDGTGAEHKADLVIREPIGEVCARLMELYREEAGEAK